MIEKKRFILMLLAAALFGAAALFTPHGATAQLGECFQCVDSDVTGCKICRHFTETGQDDCTTPTCWDCGLSNPCDPTLAAAAESTASQAIEAIRMRLRTRLVAAEAPATGAAFAATVTSVEEPAGTLAAIRRELAEHSLYLSADGSVRTCDGTEVGRVVLPSPDRTSAGLVAMIAQADVTVMGPPLRRSDGPTVSRVARQ